MQRCKFRPKEFSSQICGCKATGALVYRGIHEYLGFGILLCQQHLEEATWGNITRSLSVGDVILAAARKA